MGESLIAGWLKSNALYAIYTIYIYIQIAYYIYFGCCTDMNHFFYIRTNIPCMIKCNFVWNVIDEDNWDSSTLSPIVTKNWEPLIH